MIWKGTKAKLIAFIKDLNEKHKRKIAFLDTMLHKDENNNIQTASYCKPTDQQALLHAKSEH